MKKYADNPLQVRLHHYQDNKLSEILNLSEVTRNGIGAEGRKNVKVKFNVEKMCNSTYSEYKKLINA